MIHAHAWSTARDNCQRRRDHARRQSRVAAPRSEALAILPPTEGLPPGRIDQIPIKRIDAAYAPNYGAAYAALDVMPAKGTTLTTGARVESFAHLGAIRVSPRAGAPPHRRGRSTGFEALLRGNRGRFFGWLAYTFSRSTRHDAPGTAGRPPAACAALLVR